MKLQPMLSDRCLTYCVIATEYDGQTISNTVITWHESLIRAKNVALETALEASDRGDRVAVYVCRGAYQGDNL